MPADNELSAILRYESPREGKEKIFLKICNFLRCLMKGKTLD